MLSTHIYLNAVLPSSMLAFGWQGSVKCRYLWLAYDCLSNMSSQKGDKA